MQVFDEVNKQWIEAKYPVKIVVGYTNEQVIYGYTKTFDNLVKLVIFNNGDPSIYLTHKDTFKGKLLFSKLRGMYFPENSLPPSEIHKELLLKGSYSFPYVLEKHYEAIESFKLFENKQSLKDKNTHYKLSEYLKYTFGVEFETSQGYVPEDVCFRDGLIPLRDGSISAPEYSTIILKGNYGISLLHQQIETLKEYTDFNKECSLHIHFGNYPLTPETIFNLYKECRFLQNELELILPKYTFYSSEYKQNGKNYCKKLPTFYSFDEMYKALVARPFYGSFVQPHPNDIERKRKWEVHTRYYFVNFINALCYNVNKTIEFRFLRPTYTFKKIILWIYIFNAILEYSEKYLNKYGLGNLQNIIYKCYPKELADELSIGISNLDILTQNQHTNNDFIGASIWMEDELFNNLRI